MNFLLGNITPDRYNTVAFFDEVSSTNDVLRDMAKRGAPAGYTVVSARQTRGRGRMGRSFVSPEGGLYLSHLIRPEKTADAVTVTAWAAVAVRRAVIRVCGIALDIKWVNDLLLDGKKVCGILAESSADAEGKPFIVLGIGINANGTEFDLPAELRETAGFLSQKAGRCDPGKLAGEVIAALDEMRFAFPEDSGYLAEYRENCVTVGKNVRVSSPGWERTGRAVGINDDFSVTVEFDGGGTENIFAGEISVRNA